MSDFEKNLKKAADRYAEPDAGEPAPDCSGELEERVGRLLAQNGRKESAFMKRKTK